MSFVIQIKDNIETEQNNYQYNIIDIPKPLSKYLILEIFNIDDNEIKGLHLISFGDKTKLTIGRDKEVDIQLKDSSISHLHASISFEKGHFYLSDENSKFGTLVLLETELHLNQLHPVCGIQIGRSVLTVQQPSQEMILDEPIILKQQHSYSKQQSLEDKKPSLIQLEVDPKAAIQPIHDEQACEPQKSESEEEEDQSHNPYVFDEAPGLSLNSFTTQQLRKTQFPSFESSKFKMTEVSNEPLFQLNCQQNKIYMPSTELQKQILSCQQNE